MEDKTPKCTCGSTLQVKHSPDDNGMDYRDGMCPDCGRAYRYDWSLGWIDPDGYWVEE